MEVDFFMSRIDEGKIRNQQLQPVTATSNFNKQLRRATAASSTATS